MTVRKNITRSNKTLPVIHLEKYTIDYDTLTERWLPLQDRSKVFPSSDWLGVHFHSSSCLLLSSDSYVACEVHKKEIALLTDGRFSGGSHKYVVGHICPEAQEGGPIGLIENGDIITIDITNRRTNADLIDKELKEQRKTWTTPAYKAKRGVLYKYIKNVQSALNGCVTDE